MLVSARAMVVRVELDPASNQLDAQLLPRKLRILLTAISAVNGTTN